MLTYLNQGDLLEILRIGECRLSDTTAPGKVPWSLLLFQLLQVITNCLLSVQVFVMHFWLVTDNMAIVDDNAGKIGS